MIIVNTLNTLKETECSPGILAAHLRLLYILKPNQVHKQFKDRLFSGPCMACSQ